MQSGKIRLWFFSVIFLAILVRVRSQKQEYMPVRYAIKDKDISLPCAVPSDATFLKWRFEKNGTEFAIDAAQVFPGNIPRIFGEFNSPPGRSELVAGSLIIHQVQVIDEGYYWCEISTVSSPTAYSRKYPIHVYVTPQAPLVTGIGSSTLPEYKNTTVARCSSQAGKPGSTLVWMNGSQALSGKNDIFYSMNVFKDYLTDGSVDLRIRNPTRFDHNRMFTCIIDHPAYQGNKKTLNYTIKVLYHPVNIRMWANLTSLHVFCEADGYPAPQYDWIMPGKVGGFSGPSLYIFDLFDLPGYQYFTCTAHNGNPPNATIQMTVDELRYPDGVPGFLGLDWWVWGAILGGIAFLIIVIIVVVCCVKRKQKQGKKQKTPKGQGQKKPLMTIYKPPSSLATDNTPYNRRPGGREDSFDSRTPSPVHEHKSILVSGMYSKSREDVTLIPSEELGRSRDNVYTDNRKSMHASREQLNEAANHIQTLNQSWDQLSKSRQHLNETQDELQNTAADLRKSREQLYHSREQLNHYGGAVSHDPDNYPYIDDGTNRSNEGYPDNRPGYHQDERDSRGPPPPSYDDDRRAYGDGNYNSYRDGGYDQGDMYRQGNDSHNQDSYDNDQENRNYNSYNQGADHNRGQYNYDDRSGEQYGTDRYDSYTPEYGYSDRPNRIV